MQPNSTAVEASPPPEAVRLQLAKILASDGLAGSPRLSRFLEYAVTETLAGNEAGLKEYTVGTDVFDRPASFDPKTDPVVRVAARQLRYKLDAYYAGEGLADDVVIAIPKGGYSARIESRMRPSPQPAPARLSKQRWAAGAAAIGLLAVVIAVAIKWQKDTADAPAAPEPSVAVLPFANLSSNPENEYFSDGLTDEIITELSRMGGIRVIARGSSFQFKGKPVDTREAGRQLQVASVLVGSVARDGDRVKVAVQLERVSDGSVIRSQVYERRLADVFAVQSEVAARIAGDLGVRLSIRPAQPAPTSNVQAQDHYLRGRYEAEKFTRESLQRAVIEFEHALKLDANYAAAWYGLGVARHRLIGLQKPDQQAIEGIRNSYQKAALLNPAMAEARAGLAMIAMQFDWDWDRAERELKAAMDLPPSALVQAHYGVLLMVRGRPEDAEQYMRRALELDPLGKIVQINTAMCRFYQGKYAAARTEWERHPTVPTARLMAGYAMVLEGNPEQALKQFESLHGVIAGVEALEVMALAKAGKTAAAKELIGNVEARHGETGTPFYYMAMARASLNDDAAALAWLERSVSEREARYLLVMPIDPAFARLRTTPGFRALKARMGLTAS